MQDLTFLDDYDYTLCGDCHSSIQPYNNTSITTITELITTQQTTKQTSTTSTIIITKQTLSSTNSFTKLLISYHHLHCQKCGLYIEIHPKYDDETSQKIFICSNSDNNNPHKYCLCYHCGLLYGINPNQKSIDIINILQTQIDNMQKEKEKEEQILKKEDLYLAINDEREPENESKKTQEINEREEIKEIREEEIDQERDEDEEEDDETNSNSCSSPREEEEGAEVNDGHLDDNDDDDDSICELRKENEINKDKAIDESYLNILALKEKLSNIHVSSSFGSLKTASCPTSPNVTNNNSSPKSKFNYNTLPKSLHVSPLLGPSTPSPRVLGKDMDEMDKKWKEYVLQQKEDKERDGRDDTNKKLEEQQSQIEALQQLLNKAKTNKTNANNFALIFKRGAYSNKININKS